MGVGEPRKRHEALLEQVMVTQRGHVIMLTFRPYFDMRYNCDGRVVSSTNRSHFTTQEIP
jgi:hypothetical protein